LNNPANLEKISDDVKKKMGSILYNPIRKKWDRSFIIQLFWHPGKSLSDLKTIIGQFQFVSSLRNIGIMEHWHNGQNRVTAASA
jgi:hypothetical protein